MAGKIKWGEARDRKSIKDAINSKYESYSALQDFFKHTRDTNKSVFVLNEDTGKMEFTDDLKLAYSSIFEKLGEIEDREVKTTLEGDKLKKEADRIKGILEVLGKEQVDKVLAKDDGTALDLNVVVDRHYQELAEGRTEGKVRNTTKSTMTDKYTAATRGILLKQYFPVGLDNLDDKQIVENYEKMRLHHARLTKVSDMVKSNLLHDINYEKYLNSQNAVIARKTRTQIKKINRAKVRAERWTNFKSNVENIGSIIESIGNYFMKNSPILKSTKGSIPIPNAYMSSAIDKWAKLFSDSEVTKEKIVEKIKEEEADKFIDPNITDALQGKKVLEDGPTKVVLKEESVANLEEEAKDLVEEAEEIKDDIEEALNQEDSMEEGVELEVKGVPVIDIPTEKSNNLILNNNEQVFYRKKDDETFEKVTFTIGSENSDGLELNIVKTESLSMSDMDMQDVVKAELGIQKIELGYREITTGNETKVEKVEKTYVTEPTLMINANTLSPVEAFSHQLIFSDLSGSEFKGISDAVKKYNEYMAAGSSEEKEVNALKFEETVREFSEYIKSKKETEVVTIESAVLQSEVERLIGKNKKEFKTFKDRYFGGATAEFILNDRQLASPEFAFYYQKTKSPSVKAIPAEEFAELKGKQKPQRMYMATSESGATYKEYIERDGQFILSRAVVTDPNKKLSKKVLAQIQASKESGEFTLEGKKGSDAFVSGKDKDDNLTYQTVDDFKKSTTYLSTVILNKEFSEEIMGMALENHFEKTEAAEKKFPDMVTARRQFVSDNKELCEQVVKTYKEFCDNLQSQEMSDKVSALLKKEYKKYAKSNPELQGDTLRFAFARENAKEIPRAILKDAIKSKTNGLISVQVDDASFDGKKKGTVLKFHDEKFVVRGICKEVNESGEVVVRYRYESKSVPGLIVMGSADRTAEFAGTQQAEILNVEIIPGQKNIIIDDKLYIEQEGLFGEQQFISAEEYKKQQEINKEKVQKDPQKTQDKQQFAEQNNNLEKEKVIEEVKDIEEVNENENRLGQIEQMINQEESEISQEQGDNLEKEIENGIVSEPTPKTPQQPYGIENLSADALWQDIYKTIGELKNSNGQYKIGNTTAELLKIASNNASPEVLGKAEQKRVKDILMQAYTNHAQYMLGYDVATLFEEVKAMGIDIDINQFSGENQQEQLAKAIAEAKYKFYEGCDLSPQGWSRLALFELSQAKHNPESFDVNNRKDSPFYRELKNSGIVFDLDAYKDNIKQGIREKLEQVVTDPNGPPKEEVQIMGPDGQVIEALAVEINGVNVYIGNPPQFPLNPIETDTIDQTQNPPLVKLDDVVAEVSATREKIKTAETGATYSTYEQKTHVAAENDMSRGSAESKDIITRDGR